MTLFVGLDLGTTGGRCLVVDEGGRRVASAARPWTYRSEGFGICELDPEVAFRAMAEATREAVSGVDSQDVAAVGITSQRTGVVLVDEEGRELYTGPNADGRAIAEGAELEREYGDLIYRTAGRLPVMLYLPARLAWFRANRPDVLERTRWALAFSDWLGFRLTGTAATEPTQAAEMLVYDLASGSWSGDLCAALGVPRHLLPDIRPLGSPTGALTPDRAAELGLPPGIPIVAAGCDTQAAALGLGLTEPGEAVVVAGSTMLCQQLSGKPQIDEERKLWTSPHLAGGFVIEAHCSEAGGALDWLTRLMGCTHEAMDRGAAAGEPGGGGVFFLDAAPSHVGNFPLMRTGALMFPAPLIALARSRDDVARAALEGNAFGARAGLEWLTEAGGPASSVALGGGVSRSHTFGRILATAVGAPIRVANESNGSALGAAILAAVGAGAHGDVVGATRAMGDAGRIVDPDDSWAGPTSSAYAGWRERIARMDETTMRVGHMIGPR